MDLRKIKQSTPPGPEGPNAFAGDNACGPAPKPASSNAEIAWARIARAYGEPDARRSILQTVATIGPLVGLWLLMVWSLEYGYWITLLLAVPAAGFVVRLFMIQHDCGHGSFFRSRRLNDMLGRVIGVFTLTPYEHWRKAHAIHHATSGNLGRRGVGDVDLLTVDEYLALPRWRRLVYRLYRNPVVIFGVGPIYLFVLKHRLPLLVPNGGRRGVYSVLWTNLGIAAFVALAMVAFGVTEFLLVQAPITMLASSIGVWLFFVQHQFERTYWEPDARWSFHTAALRGSSYYVLPRVLRWFTASIGIHHVHHLCSRIPNYRLQECLDDHAGLRDFSRVTLLDSLKCVRLTLWDEDAKRLIGFRQLRARSAEKKADSPPSVWPANR